MNKTGFNDKAKAPEGNASRGDLVRRKTLHSNLLLVALSVVAVSLWVKITTDEVLEEMRDETQRILRLVADPYNRLLNEVNSSAESQKRTIVRNFKRKKSFDYRSLTIKKGGGSHYSLVGRMEKGDQIEKNFPKPAKESHLEYVKKLKESKAASIISLPFSYRDGWYVTYYSRFNFSGVPDLANNFYYMQTFSLVEFLQINSVVSIPEGSALSIQRDDGDLWLSNEINDLSKTVPYDASEIAKRKGFKTTVDFDGVEREVCALPLSQFNLSAIAGYSVAEATRIWRKRYLVSVIFAIGACMVLTLVIFTGARSVNKEVGKRQKAVLALRNSQRRLQDIADAATDWFWEIDSDFRFVYLSKRAEEVSGLIPADYLGRTPASLSETGHFGEKLHRILKSRLPFRDFILDVCRPDGEIRILRLSGQPNFTEPSLTEPSLTEQSVFTGYRGAVTDITEQERAREKLEAVQTRLSRAFENFSGGVTLFDSDRRLVAFNHRFTELFFPGAGHHVQVGMSYEELLERYIKEGTDPRAQRSPDNFRKILFNAHGRLDSEYRLPGDVWLKVTDHLMPEGELFTVYANITEFKRRERALLELSRENQRLVAAVDATDSGVFIVDMTATDYPLVYQNQAFLAMTGYRTGEIPGFNREFLQPDGKERDETICGKIQTFIDYHEHAALDMQTRRRDGSLFWSHCTLTKVRTGSSEARYIAGILYDITANKEAEQELTFLKETAETASRSKSDFLAMMSHELRTPLNAILGFSEIISQQMFGAIGDERYVTYSEDINSSGKHLLDLINDILDLSKAEAGKIDLFEENLDIKSIVNRCVSMLKGRADAGHLKLISDVEDNMPGIIGDERRLKQILINLISNAVKFTEKGGEIRVKASKESDTLVLAVVDNGIGIDEKDIKNAVIPFGQVDCSLSRRYEGTGLGLPLAKRLTELHGARFELESVPGKGTTVRLAFPQERLVFKNQQEGV